MRIQEVAQSFQISVDTLRYYEKIGLIDEVQKVNGIRSYQEKDIDRIKFIKCMKKSGMSLENISRYFNLYNRGETTLDERLDLLEEQKMKALEEQNELQKSIDYLEFKIDLTKQNLKKFKKKNS